MRAIEAKELPAFRDNRNRWQIIQQELENWAGAQRALCEQRSSDAHHDAHYTKLNAYAPGANRDNLAEDLAAARLTIAQLEARLQERAALVSAAEARAQMAEADRDRWRSLGEKLIDRLAEHEAQAPASVPNVSKYRRWWSWRSDR